MIGGDADDAGLERSLRKASKPWMLLDWELLRAVKASSACLMIAGDNCCEVIAMFVFDRNSVSADVLEVSRNSPRLYPLRSCYR